MFNRLTTRLVLSHLLVISVAMLLLSFLLLSLVQGYFMQSLQQSLTTQARLTAQALVQAPGTVPALPPAQNAVQRQQTNQISVQVENLAPDGPALDNITVRLSAELDTRIRVLDVHGAVQADSAGAEQGRDLHTDPAVTAALRGQEEAITQDGWMFVAVPLRRQERIVGVVYLGQPLRDVGAVLADLQFRLLLSAAAALVLSALVGWMLARAIARPVRELTRAANHLARGDFDYPLQVQTRDELGELARAFRSMSGDLQRTLQARTDLVGNVSHELRTPLTAIKGAIETLRDGAVDDPNARDRFLASVEGETDRLIRLVNDLLTLSRADAQSLALRRERFDVAELARACVDELAPAAAPRVSFSVEGSAARVNADPDRVRQVLVNLLDNAIRYSPPGGTVRVSVASGAEGVAVSVHDDGPGIPAADQARVFERFYRADRSRARDAQGAAGAGLGLAIVRALVKAHGGAVALTSSEGEGTTVRFTLPAS